MRQLTADMPLRLEFRKRENGPSAASRSRSKVSADQGNLEEAVHALREHGGLGWVVDIGDNRPLPGIEMALAC